jgi:ABC-type branched-subunit amino acid transport system substrate-binding protein
MANVFLGDFARLLRRKFLFGFGALIGPILFLCQAHAQGFPSEIRIGVILPEPSASDESSLRDQVIEMARMGLVMAEEEHSFNSEMFGIEFAVITGHAPEGQAANVAERILTEDGVFGIAGGFDEAEARALGEWAEERGIPFLNVGASADSLRNEECFATSFHVAPSAAMYLDSIAGWFIRAGFRQWYFIRDDTAEFAAQQERAVWSLRERHFGARQAGVTVLDDGRGLSDADLADLGGSGADLVVLLLDADRQIEVMRDLDAAGVTTMITGFPTDEAQTQAFFREIRETLPGGEPSFRATAWEPTLDAYGAREFNARFFMRWNQPMESPAWAVYQAVKILYEAAFFGQSVEPEDIIRHMQSPDVVFDVWKGIGTSFRAWDRQLRQSVYLVEIGEVGSDPEQVGLLVGELPAIYMPGTDPVERLDQLGDLAAQSRCAR